MSSRALWAGLFVIMVVAVTAYWLYGSAGNKTLAVKTDKTLTLNEEVEAVQYSKQTKAGNGGSTNDTPSIWRQPTHVVADDGSAAIPQRYQFEGVKRVQTGRDFEDWMARFSDSDQVVLRGFDKQFFGLYQNRDPNQIAWMAANGYPMPEDVLAAQSMSAAQLRDQAAQGNIKAAYLLKSRELDQIEHRMQANNQTYGEVLDDDPQMADDLYNVRRQIRNSPSPYRGFLLARQEAVNAGDSVGVDVLAALYLARMLGDNGARSLITQYINGSPNSYVRDHRHTAKAALEIFYARLLLLNAAGGPTGGPKVEFGIRGDIYPLPH